VEELMMRGTRRYKRAAMLKTKAIRREARQDLEEENDALFAKLRQMRGQQ
jgi:hypothetical protein